MRWVTCWSLRPDFLWINIFRVFLHVVLIVPPLSLPPLPLPLTSSSCILLIVSSLEAYREWRVALFVRPPKVVQLLTSHTQTLEVNKINKIIVIIIIIIKWIACIKINVNLLRGYLKVIKSYYKLLKVINFIMCRYFMVTNYRLLLLIYSKF